MSEIPQTTTNKIPEFQISDKEYDEFLVSEQETDKILNVSRRNRQNYINLGKQRKENAKFGKRVHQLNKRFKS